MGGVSPSPLNPLCPSTKGPPAPPPRSISDTGGGSGDGGDAFCAPHRRGGVHWFPPQVVVIKQNGSFQLGSPKNFVCDHCCGAFRSSYHLKRHILIHTGTAPLPPNER